MIPFEYEYCVMMERYPEPHRGPWSQKECEDWIQEGEEDGIKPGTFYVAWRAIGPWIKE
jgi:hypothetical protein